MACEPQSLCHNSSFLSFKYETAIDNASLPALSFQLLFRTRNLKNYGMKLPSLCSMKFFCPNDSATVFEYTIIYGKGRDMFVVHMEIHNFEKCPE